MGNKLVIIRHGETYDNYERIFSGRRDVDLTPRGVEQAEQLAERLKNYNIRLAFSSPLIRTTRTLQIVLQHHPRSKICLDRRIIERSYGMLEGQSKEKWARRAYPIFKLFHRSFRVPPPRGENYIAVKKRVENFLEDIINISRTYNEDMFVCLHGNSLRPIRQHFESLTDKEFVELETNPGDIFEYEIN